MMNLKQLVSAALVMCIFAPGIVGCSEKPPAKNEIKVTTPGGTTVTIKKPVEPPAQNPPPAKP
jgi:hypothetical protein